VQAAVGCLWFKGANERVDCGLHGSVDVGRRGFGFETQQMPQLDIASH
jgi:hypothetical protein